MAAPFFVIGYPRSGTTLLQCMLNAHPQLAVPAETRFVIRNYERRHLLGDLRLQANREQLAGLMFTDGRHHMQDLGLPEDVVRRAVVDAPGTFGSIVDAVFSEFARANGKLHWGDKHPRYTRHVRMLLDLFPDARIVHLVRDPRDGVESLMRMPWYTRDHHHATWTWALVDDIARRWQRRLGPGRFHELSFESLVQDPEAALRPLAAFLGVEFHDDMTHPDVGAQTGLPKDRVFHKAIRTGIRPELKQAWRTRLDPDVLSVVEHALGHRMERRGYEVSGAPMPGRAERAAYRRVAARRTWIEVRHAHRQWSNRRRYPYPIARVDGPLSAS